MEYKDVVRQTFAKHKGMGMKPQAIMKLASLEYNKIKGKGKGKSPKGAGLFGDIGHGIDSISSLFGLGLKKPKMMKGKGKAKGAGLFGDLGTGIDSIGSLFGLGLKKPKMMKGARKLKGGQYSAGALSVEDLADLSPGFEGMGSTSRIPNLGGMTGGSSSGGAIMHSRRMRGGSASGGGLQDILKTALPFLALI